MAEDAEQVERRGGGHGLGGAAVPAAVEPGGPSRELYTITESDGEEQ